MTLEAIGALATDFVGTTQNPGDGTLILRGPLSAAWPTSGLVSVNVSNTELERATISGTTLTMISGGRAYKPLGTFTTAQTHPAGDVVTLVADWTAMQNMFPWKFDDQTLLSNAASITIAAIPGTGFTLRIKGQARGDTAANNTNLLVRFNGDTGSNDGWSNIQDLNATLSGGTTNPSTSLVATAIPAASSPANLAGEFEIVIVNYSGTTFQKTMQTVSGPQIATGVAGGFVFVSAGVWGNTGAITSISLFPQAGNLIGPGTRVVTMIEP